MKNTTIFFLCHLLCLMMGVKGSGCPTPTTGDTQIFKQVQMIADQQKKENNKQRTQLLKKQLEASKQKTLSQNTTIDPSFQQKIDNINSTSNERSSQNQEEMECLNSKLGNLNQQINSILKKDTNSSKPDDWIVTENGSTQIDWNEAPAQALRIELKTVFQKNIRLNKNNAHQKELITFKEQRITSLNEIIENQDLEIDNLKQTITEQQKLLESSEEKLTNTKQLLQETLREKTDLQSNVNSQSLTIARLELIKEELAESLSTIKNQQNEINTQHEDLLNRTFLELEKV